MNRSLLIAALLAAAPALAQGPEKPKTETKTDAAPPLRVSRATSSSEDDGSGPGLGLRGAWALPTGGITSDQSLGDAISWQLPVWLEAGYHFNRNLYAGAYFQYAFGFTNCLAGASCSSSGTRFGIEAIYKLIPAFVVQPWVGLGVGYEILNRNRSGDDNTYKGLELLNLQAGLDIPVTKRFSIGPFASYQLFGKFTSFNFSGISNSPSNTTGHGWWQAGLKAGFRL